MPGAIGKENARFLGVKSKIEPSLYSQSLTFFFYRDSCYRDRRSLFPENPRPPPGLDSCVCANGFFGLAPSSATTLGGPRRLWCSPPVSGRFPTPSTRFRREILRPDFFNWFRGWCFVKTRAKTIQIRKIDFFLMDHSCSFLDRSETLETTFCWILGTLWVRLQ